MKLIVTADLHYDNPRSRQAALDVAARIADEAPDVLVLAGDTAGADLGVFAEALRLFEPVRARKLLVPGNHCLWTRPGEGSLDRYRRVLPEVCGQAGFTVLDHEPVVIDGVGLAGSIGWYDYRFADAALGIPLEFYRAKVSPGAAAYLGGYEDLLAVHEAALTPALRSLGMRWMDGQHVRLPIDDEAFVAQLADRLAAQLDELCRRVDRIAVFMHHLPFAELVPSGRPSRLAFAAAYMGSPRLGQVLLDCPALRTVYCGHSHWPARCRVGHVEAINIGSTYVEKRYEVLELQTCQVG